MRFKIMNANVLHGFHSLTHVLEKERLEAMQRVVKKENPDDVQTLETLNERHKNATTFIIAHRISAVKNADQIAYIENGTIVESGTHDELLEKKGKYYEIYREQFKDFDALASSKEVV